MAHAKACIFNIQKYSIHDGPGIRTVVFFKGCPLQCTWCSNPESQSPGPELALSRQKCIQGPKCPLGCPYNSENTNNKKPASALINEDDLFQNVKSCPEKALTLYGTYQTLDTILEEVMKDKDFYDESGGGVTLSGGEVFLQHAFASGLLKQLKAKGIHTAVETTGYASANIFKTFITHVDLLLLDIKHYDSQKHFEVTGVHNEKILANLKTAASMNKEIIVRIPVIPTMNDTPEDARAFCRLLKEIGILKVSLLPFHQFGEKKYSLLNKEYKFANVPQLHAESLQEYKEIFIKYGFSTNT